MNFTELLERRPAPIPPTARQVRGVGINDPLEPEASADYRSLDKAGRYALRAQHAETVLYLMGKRDMTLYAVMRESGISAHTLEKILPKLVANGFLVVDVGRVTTYRRTDKPIE